MCVRGVDWFFIEQLFVPVTKVDSLCRQHCHLRSPKFLRNNGTALLVLFNCLLRMCSDENNGVQIYSLRLPMKIVYGCIKYDYN